MILECAASGTDSDTNSCPKSCPCPFISDLIIFWRFVALIRGSALIWGSLFSLLYHLHLPEIYTLEPQQAVELYFFISMIASDECSLWNRGFIRTNICWGWGANGVSTDGVSELSHRTINSWLNESPSQIRFVGQWEAEVQTLAVDWSRFGLFKPFDTDKNQFGTMSVKLRYLWLHAIMHKPTHAGYMVLKS